ncbi:hypothetical protein JCM19231_1911 [Vibrio ishigakensis]|uniref:Uncharacterized protein n=1 Tax=Vibrio ishigakensis TaxID=1481914 RepID=A0A0B8NK53_9VIBR|nr:hypothetical protein [Vibrio ishigakensis]GAM55095.1 hypothetical protein JCM19231_1911 [Vibrio ishigakensis]
MRSIYKYILVSSCLLATGSVLAEDEAKSVDMADPTAVYSSVGARLDADGNFDVTTGFSWGSNLLLAETKDGFDALKFRYAHMNLWNSIGVYAESKIELDGNSGSTASIGGISTIQINDSLKFHPVLVLGGLEIEEDDWIATSTLGLYTRAKLYPGLSLGFDPFISVGESGYNSFSADLFLSYQMGNNQIRLGYTGSSMEYDDLDYDKSFDGEAYIQYKIAF